MIQPPRKHLARLPTPLEPLDRLSADLQEHGIETRIWIKRDDLTDTIASGNKIRKLEFSIGQALAEEANVLVTWGGVQSNHCRATAQLAARLGLKSHLILRGNEPDEYDGNLLIDRLVGANVTFAPLPEYQQMDDTYAELQTRYANQGLRTYRIPVGASDEIGLWGYIACAEELKSDFESLELKPDAIVSATGSGGTLAGLILGNHLYKVDTTIYAFNVCDDEAYFLKKISEDFTAWRSRYDIEVNSADIPINVIEGYVGPGYGRANPEVFDTIHRVARLEGIVLDPVYTGKAFHGMLTELDQGRFQGMKDIVFVHTGGMLGLFPQKHELFATSDQVS
ncbi:MAG: D-cysteine desulfhydrase family protein [Pseudomonadales bacterium]|nr:D-cysteine desulfhydrase family protein [Pseudomonadales bacterium]MBO6658944.1 D-cysteine desulfhydrase family protein [Pseudomonadales bacterium]